MSVNRFIKKYTGKTKDIFSVPKNRHLLAVHFKDFALYKNKILDSGGNESRKTFKNKGKHCLFITDYFFRLFEKHGIKTHYVKKFSPRKILVLKTRPIPVEFILRNYAWGTYTERFPDVKKLAPLGGIIEFTLKSDRASDPFLSDKEILKYVSKREVFEIRKIMKKINSLVAEVCKKKNIKLVDFKVEFGRRGNDLLLIDDFSTDTARFLRGGKLLSPAQLSELLK